MRTGRASDAPAVGLVQATVWQDAYRDRLPAEVIAAFEGARFAAIWRRSLESSPSPVHRLLVACAGAQVVGYASLAPVEDAAESGLPPSAGVVLDVGVHPEARRQGHGSRLINAVADTARAQDLTALVAWVPAEDATALAFLATAGLEPDGAWREAVVSEAGATLRHVRLRAEL